MGRIYYEAGNYRGIRSKMNKVAGQKKLTPFLSHCSILFTTQKTTSV